MLIYGMTWAWLHNHDSHDGCLQVNIMTVLLFPRPPLSLPHPIWDSIISKFIFDAHVTAFENLALTELLRSHYKYNKDLTSRFEACRYLPLSFKEIQLWLWLVARPRAIFFLQTRIAIPRYFSQSYGAYFKYIVHVHVHKYCKCLRDVNYILRHLKIRAIWLAEISRDGNRRLQKKNCRPRVSKRDVKFSTRSVDEFQIDPVRALPHWNRGSLCQVTNRCEVDNRTTHALIIQRMRQHWEPRYQTRKCADRR